MSLVEKNEALRAVYVRSSLICPDLALVHVQDAHNRIPYEAIRFALPAPEQILLFVSRFLYRHNVSEILRVARQRRSRAG